jgi:GT2 family glycosyltransferase
MQPSISIITVNYRSWNRLRQCLDSVHLQEGPQVEMIVVDNHSDDGMAASFTREYEWVQFILQPINGGFAQACNKGASVAKGKWLLFLNPDSVLEPGVLDTLLSRVAQEPDWKLVGIRQYDDDGKDQHQFGNFPRWWTVWPQMRTLERLIRGKENYKHYLNTAPVSYPDWISGCFILIREGDFRSLGGWDQRFWMYSEDIDLCKRASDIGWKRVMYNEVRCLHAHGGSSRINVATKAMTKSEVIRSEYRYIHKHFSGLGKGFGLLTLFLVRGIELILASPFSAVRRKMLVNLTTGKAQPRVGYELPEM